MSDFLPVPSEQEWTESDRQWFELVRSLRSQVVQLQTTISTLTAALEYLHRCVSPGLQSRIDAALAQKPEEEARP